MIIVSLSRGTSGVQRRRLSPPYDKAVAAAVRNDCAAKHKLMFSASVFAAKRLSFRDHNFGKLTFFIPYRPEDPPTTPKIARKAREHF